MPFGGPNSERALILAPRGRDAEVASRLLREAGWPTLICADVARLCHELSKGAALSVVVEEALATDDLAALVDCMKAQPAWSDFPIIVLTGRGDTLARNALANRLQDILGNDIRRPGAERRLQSLTSRNICASIVAPVGG